MRLRKTPDLLFCIICLNYFILIKEVAFTVLNEGVYIVRHHCRILVVRAMTCPWDHYDLGGR